MAYIELISGTSDLTRISVAPGFGISSVSMTSKGPPGFATITPFIVNLKSERIDKG